VAGKDLERGEYFACFQSQFLRLMFVQMQTNIFNNSRKASAIGVAVSKILLVYKDVKYMLTVIGFSFNPNMPEDDALCAIKIAIDDARESGTPLSTVLTPWEYYIWTRDPKDRWYNLVDAK
jgi:hypothetical protein